MIKRELIKKLKDIPGNPRVFIEITEPYDEHSETLEEIVTEVEFDPSFPTDIILK